MKVAIKFEQYGEELMRHVFEVSNDDDLMAGHREAFEKFRKMFPQASLFEGNFMVGYDKA